MRGIAWLGLEGAAAMSASAPQSLTRRSLINRTSAATVAAAALLGIGRADAAETGAAAAALLERYNAAVNAHDTGPFAAMFTEGYIQHSGRSPSGLPAQIANFQ